MPPKKTKKSTKSPKKRRLNPKQEAFCRLYAGADFMDKDLFGNGTFCYLEVYKPKRVGNWYNTARSSASQLLTNINIIERINQLLETGGLTDENADRQLLFLMNQHADFKSKISAIKEYNALKARIQKKIDLTSGGKSIFDEKTKEKADAIIESYLRDKADDSQSS